MNYTDIIVEKKEKAVWITLNKPQVKNAMGSQTIKDLDNALEEIEKDGSVVAIVIKGAGDAFCSGMDLREISKFNATEQSEFHRRADRMFNHLENSSKVTIAVIRGITMAGGLELAMLCDVIIADENCKVGDGHIKSGLIPGGGASQRLPRLIGTRKAKELLYTGDLISGKEAVNIGLVNRAVSADQLEKATEEFIGKIADKPPLALAASKLLVNRGMETSLATGLQFEAEVVKGLQATEDFKESMTAFMEKRKPVYRGK